MPIRPLCPVLAEKARTELNEDSVLVEEKLQQFKQWVISQKHLSARTDDQWLIAFLRGCKYRMEQAKSKFDMYYSLRSTAPYLYSLKFNDPKVIDYLDSGSVIISPNTINAAYPKIIMYRLGKYDPKDKNLVELLSVSAFLEQICFMEDDSFVVAGTVHILDFAGTKFSHYTQTSFSELRTLAQARQNALPIRIKKIHFLNTPPFFGTFFKIAKILLSEKNNQRILFHNKNISALHEYVPKEMLPEEYGGCGYTTQECVGVLSSGANPGKNIRSCLSKTCIVFETEPECKISVQTDTEKWVKFNLQDSTVTYIHDYWKNKLREYHSFFEEDSRYGSDETKRPRNNQSIDFD